MSGEAVALSLFGLGEPVPVVSSVRVRGRRVEVEAHAFDWASGPAEGVAGGASSAGGPGGEGRGMAARAVDRT